MAIETKFNIGDLVWICANRDGIYSAKQVKITRIKVDERGITYSFENHVFDISESRVYSEAQKAIEAARLAAVEHHAKNINGLDKKDDVYVEKYR